VCETELLKTEMPGAVIVV